VNKVLISPRESEVLKYLALGLTNVEIAKVLKLSNQTVKNYILSIEKKTGIGKYRRALLALFALKYGHVTREEMNEVLDSALNVQKET
jgi:DNA-binding NarL/FixJ family response regulator